MNDKHNGNRAIARWAGWLNGALAGALAASLAYGATSFLAYFKDTCTRYEVSAMIQAQSPYLRDQNLILDKLTSIHELAKANAAAIRRIEQQLPSRGSP